MGNVKNNVLRLTGCCLTQICLPSFDPIGDMQRTVIVTNILFTAELRHECSTVTAPKIQPGRPEHEVNPPDELRREHRAVPRRTEHKLNAVKIQFLYHGRKGICISVKNMFHIAVRIGQVRQFKHDQNR